MTPDDRPRSLVPYIAAGVVLVLLAMRVFAGAGGGDAPAVALDGARPAPAARARAGARVWVHVAGAVRRPGLYRVPADARAGAAVDAAGGLTRRADQTAVNLAGTLRDGQQLVVPVRGAARAEAPAGAAGAAGHAGAGEGGKIRLSTATVEQLDTLDGLGPTLAKRIVQWRDAHGGFESIEQLREVE